MVILMNHVNQNIGVLNTHLCHDQLAYGLNVVWPSLRQVSSVGGLNPLKKYETHLGWSSQIDLKNAFKKKNVLNHQLDFTLIQGNGSREVLSDTGTETAWNPESPDLF